MLYVTGKGVSKDAAKGVAIYRKAAELGDGYGMFNLGMSLYEGSGVAKNEDEATKWIIEGLRKAGLGLANIIYDRRKNYTVATRKWMQRALRDVGAYDGRIDGIFGPKVKQALETVAGKG